VRALVIATLGLSSMAGCFYIDPINQRPSIDIRQTSADEVYRASTVSLVAVDDDPEGQVVFFSWRARACDDAADESTCDAVPFYTGELRAATFVVPVMRTDAAVPVRSILVVLQAQDDHGAIARPDSRLIIPVADHPPALDLRVVGRARNVVNTPIDIFARVSDPDDAPPSVLRVDWKVYTPTNQPEPNLIDLSVPNPMPLTELQLGKTFMPNDVGTWEVQVTVTDPLDVSTQLTQMIEVGADHAPCLAVWAPITAPAGEALPVSDATLFQVSVIDDDLDPYPTPPNNALAQPPSFTWKIKQPGASAFSPLAATGSSVPLDPGSYTPGDIVELRVEIADRNDTAITCAADQDTCSVISEPSCIQRLTWRVEVR